MHKIEKGTNIRMSENMYTNIHGNKPVDIQRIMLKFISTNKLDYKKN